MSLAAPRSLVQTGLRLARSPWGLLALGFGVLYAPTLFDLFTGIWAFWETDAQAHGPLILALSTWLLWRRRDAMAAPSQRSSPFFAWLLVLLSLSSYVLGRSQGLMLLELGSMVPMVGAVLLFRGMGALKAGAFGLFFLLFMIPLPGQIVDVVTQPMKIAVSVVTEFILFNLGYPIARSGVVLQIAQYQLQVADACAGLNTLFTLEALGLVYLNIVRHASMVRNMTLAVLIIPLSFTANVIRVMTLTLVTYYFGDEAAQGFIHGFAGMVLLIVALLLIMAMTDLFLRLGVRSKVVE
jgi:exosortase B